jgi:hypothetical protein
MPLQDAGMRTQPADKTDLAAHGVGRFVRIPHVLIFGGDLPWLYLTDFTFLTIS